MLRAHTTLLRRSFRNITVVTPYTLPTLRSFHTTITVHDEQKNKGRGGMITMSSLAGTRDFLPQQMKVRNWLFKKMHDAAALYGFQEYDTPILEPDELYKRKGGEEISQQMYCFIDRSGQAVALRPEMTPSLARIILAQGASLLLPIKWYSIPQCWRFETTTKARKREHYQLNMDIWGTTSVNAEAELLAAICHLFTSLGLDSNDVGIKISSRKVLQAVMDKNGITEEQFAPACVIVDKLDKIGEEEVIVQLQEIGITGAAAQAIIELTSISSIDDLKNKMGADTQAVKEIIDLFVLAKEYGIESFLQFDASIVRGLTYYTGIVFEAFSKGGEIQRAICGGGRYDRILTTYGAPKDIPACGFGLGDVVLLEILAEKNLIPDLFDVPKDLVVPFNEGMRPQAVQLVNKMRKLGINVDIYVGSAKKLKHALSYADRVGSGRVIMVMPDEWKENKVAIKNLRTGTQEAVSIDNLFTKEIK
jgi:histidyl-tRNA synthetase